MLRRELSGASCRKRRARAAEPASPKSNRVMPRNWQSSLHADMAVRAPTDLGNTPSSFAPSGLNEFQSPCDLGLHPRLSYFGPSALWFSPTSFSTEGPRHDLLRFLDDAREVSLIFETLGVN